MKFLTILLLFFVTCSPPTEPKEQGMELQREAIICNYNDWNDLETIHFIPETYAGDWIIIFVSYIEEMQNTDVTGNEIGIFWKNKCVGAVKLCPDGTIYEVICWNGEYDWTGDKIEIKYWDYSQDMELHIRSKFLVDAPFNGSGLFLDWSLYGARLFLGRRKLW